MKLYHKYKNIWQCKNKSGSLSQIKKQIEYYLSDFEIEYDTIGNMYVGDFTEEKPCIVAHLDSVHNKVGQVYCDGEILFSTKGIGGDDKCGLIAGIEIIKRCDVNLLFTIDEEIGGIGARAVDLNRLKTAQYFIEIDRRGSGDCITNLGFYEDTVTADFMDCLENDLWVFGFKKASGSYTDLCDILPETKVCGINLSAGYYEPHTNKEYIVLSELQNTINFVVSVCNSVRQRFDLPEEAFKTKPFSMYAPIVDDLSSLLSIDDVFNYLEHIYGYDEDLFSLVHRAYELGLQESDVTPFFLEDIKC